jgi:thiol-disulfide isomerase/thioredoxin
MKLFLSLFTLIFLFFHQVAFAEIPTEVNLSANQQEKIYKQINNLYDDLEIKLSKFDEKTQLKKFKTIQSKISNILEKNVSDKIYFSLFYLNTLLNEKIDILEQNQKRISQVDPNIDLTEKNGNKTFVGFVATWCPHCTSEVPVLDSFYKENKGKVNMQLMVTDGKYFDGDFSIPQDLKNSLTYEQVT